MNLHHPLGPILGLFLLLTGCSALQEQLTRSTPEVSVDGIRIVSLGFDAIDLLVDVRVDNPNPVGVQVAGLDYELRLDGKRAISGESAERAGIPARGSGTVSVPVTLGYQDLYERFGTLRDRDAVDYALELGIDVDVPVLGVQRLSASASDTLPLPGWPSVSLRDVRIDRLGLDGARLIMDIDVDNPNSFALDIGTLRYQLSVDGQDWISGTLDQPARIAPKEGASLSIPVELDLASMGSGVYRMLTEGRMLDYQLRGNLAGTADESRLGSFEFDFDDAGAVAPGQ